MVVALSEAPRIPELSIIIPAWNEQRRLPATLRAVCDYARYALHLTEIVIVDDGSTDGTPHAIERFTRELLRDADLTTRVWALGLRNERNRGKGHAVRRGMLAATGALCLMCDADLSTPIQEWTRLRDRIAKGFDIVIGSRDLPESRLDPPQPLFRRLSAWGFRWLRRRMLVPAIRDTQCGFKLFTADAARRVFERATVDGWLFDCEALAIAEHLGLRIAEVGVTWQDDRDSRVRALPVALRAWPELRAIKRRWVDSPPPIDEAKKP